MALTFDDLMDMKAQLKSNSPWVFIQWRASNDAGMPVHTEGPFDGDYSDPIADKLISIIAGNSPSVEIVVLTPTVDIVDGEIIHSIDKSTARDWLVHYVPYVFTDKKLADMVFLLHQTAPSARPKA
jgi:hypothetical protein